MRSWASLPWALFFCALAAVPDEKPLRLKLLALEAAVLAAGLAAAWRASRSERCFARTPADVAVALWACAAAVFWASSGEPAASAPELSRALTGAVVFFAASQGFAAVERPALVLLWWPLAGAAAAALAWKQWRFGGEARPFGTFGNPIFLGQFLAASAAATLALLVLLKDRLARAGLASAFVLQLMGLWLAQSRAAFLGLAGALGLWLVLRAPKRARLPLGAALALVCAVLYRHFEDRAPTHLLIWKGAWRMWLDHPLLGSGLGRFHLDFPDYAPLELRALWPKARVIVNYAHNEYLQLLAETGAVGLLAYLAAPLTLLKRLAPEPRTDKEALADVPALAAAALLAGAFAAPDMRFGVSSIVCMAALGAAAGLRLSAWTGWRSVPDWSRAPALAACLLTLATWARLAVQPFLTERALQAQPEFAPLPERTAESHQESGYRHARLGNWKAAAASFEAAAAQAPADPAPLNNLGNVYYSMGDPGRAEAYWRRAAASAPAAPGAADAHVNLAKLLYERGDLKASARHAQAALAVQPGNPKALALLKRLTGG